MNSNDVDVFLSTAIWDKLSSTTKEKTSCNTSSYSESSAYHTFVPNHMAVIEATKSFQHIMCCGAKDLDNESRVKMIGWKLLHHQKMKQEQCDVVNG